MALHQPSQLSLIGAGIYSLVATVCILAAVLAIYRNDDRSRAITWIALVAFFCLLAAMRTFNLEDALRDGFRALLRSSNIYDERRAWQAPIALSVLVVAMLGFAMQIQRLRKASISRLAATSVIAQLAAALMVALIGLRLVSLHAIDALLYGSIKLNWLVDMGSAAAVALCAGTYCWTLARESEKPRSRP